MTLGQWLIGIKNKITTIIEEMSALSNEVDDLDERAETLERQNHLVEEGTSGHWIYRKWSSGFCECWHDCINVPISANSAVSGNVVVDFPFEITDPKVNFGLWQNTSSAGNAGIIDIARLTSTQITLRAHRNSATADAWAVTPATFITIVGRWK